MTNDFISMEDSKRIADDARIAIDSLKSLCVVVADGSSLHPKYIAEKARVAQNCLDFIKSFIPEDKL